MRFEEHKDFFGMSPGKFVGLKYGFGLSSPCILLVKDVIVDENFNIMEVVAEVSKESVKPKVFLNWIAEAVHTYIQIVMEHVRL